MRYIVASAWNAELHYIHRTAAQAMEMQRGCRCDHSIFGSADALGLSEKEFLRQRRCHERHDAAYGRREAVLTSDY